MQGKPTLPRYRRLLAIVVKDLQGYLTVQTERLGPSGSVVLTAKRHRAYRIGTLEGEWQCERNAHGRVAVPLTLPLAGERTGQCAMHCQTASSVPYWYDRGRVAVRPVRRGSSGSISWDGSFASSRPPLSSLFSLLDTASLILRYAPGRGWGTSPRVAHLGYRAAS